MQTAKVPAAACRFDNMAWQSFLTVDGTMMGTWFNGAPHAATLLFREDQLVVDGEQVRLCTTAAEALACLAAAGFTWEMIVGDYAEARQISGAAAFLCGIACAERARETGAPSDPDPTSEYEAFLENLNQVSPADELRGLAELVMQQAVAQQAHWDEGHLDDEVERSVLDGLLSDSSELPDPRALPAPLAARLCRPLEYFIGLRSEVPAIGWLLAVMTVVRSVEPGTRIALDITEGASPKYNEGAPEAFGRDFFESGREEVRRTANVYGRIFANLQSATTEFGRSARYGTLASMLHQLSDQEVSRAVRGRRLEELVAGIVDLNGGGLQVVARNVRHDDEELDLVLRNDLADPFWRNFNSPVILVECKNWSSRVDTKELRILQTKMQDRGRLCSIGLFIGLHGFTRPFLDRVRDLQTQGITVFPITRDDLEELIHRRVPLAEWLRETGLQSIL